MTAKQRKSRSRIVSSFRSTWKWFVYWKRWTEREREPKPPRNEERENEIRNGAREKCAQFPLSQVEAGRSGVRLCAGKVVHKRRCTICLGICHWKCWALWPHHQHCNAKCYTMRIHIRDGGKNEKYYCKSAQRRLQSENYKSTSMSRWGEIHFGCQLASCLVGDLFACLLRSTHTLSGHAAMAIVRILSMFYYSICWSSFCYRFFFCYFRSLLLQPVSASLWFMFLLCRFCTDLIYVKFRTRFVSLRSFKLNGVFSCMR